MGKRDPEGYYAALNVSHKASRQEIRLAYELLKQAFKKGQRNLRIGKIQAAYETLSDPRQRRQYDGGGSSSTNRRGGKSRLHSAPLVLTLTVVFLGALAFVIAPHFRTDLVNFDVGDNLYWQSTDKALGVVLEFDDDHVFPVRAPVPAYLVQPATGKEPIWFPARDLSRHCGARK